MSTTKTEPEKLTYGSDSHPVDERDAFALIKARKECSRDFQWTIGRLTAPVVRGFNAFIDRFDDVQRENPDLEDPLYFTYQFLLGLVDLEGYRYYKLVKLDEPITPRRRAEEYEKYVKERQEAEDEIQQRVSDIAAKKAPQFIEWPHELQVKAGEFAGFLKTARDLYRRYPHLVKAKDFPQPYRFAWQQEIAEGNEHPDSALDGYDDRELVENGFLVCWDPAFSTHVEESKRKRKAESKAEEGGAGNTDTPRDQSKAPVDTITQQDLRIHQIVQGPEYAGRKELIQRLKSGAVIEPGELTIADPYIDLGPLVVPAGKTEGERSGEADAAE